MSLGPFLFSDWWQDLNHPHRLLDQNFGLGLRRDQLVQPSLLDDYYLHPRERRRNPLLYYRPWGELMRQGEGGGTSTVKADKDKFEVILDVQQFTPEEINVKVVDRFVVVEAKHEEKQDEHGTISRQFVRKYMIPEQCDIDQVSSSLSSDGVLSITAPRKEQPKSSNEKVVQIQQTGKPAVQSTDNKKEKEDETSENKN